MYEVDCVSVNKKAQERVISGALEGIAGNTLKSIQSKGNQIKDKCRAFAVNTLEIGKLLGEMQALFNNNEQFFAYAEYECGMAESTTYAAMATYNAWEFADIKKLPGILSASVLAILAGREQEDLRKRIVELAEAGNNITANMARAAVKLFKAGKAAHSLTVNLLVNPEKFLPEKGSDEDGEENGGKEDQKEYDFNDGKNVKVKVIVCGEADNSDILNALEAAKKDFPLDKKLTSK